MNEVLSRRFGERVKAYKKSPHMIVQGADTPTVCVTSGDIGRPVYRLRSPVGPF